MPVACDAWLSSLGMQAVGSEDFSRKATDQDDTEADSSGPDNPATEPVGVPRKRQYSDELAFRSGAHLSQDVDRGLEAVLKLQGECAAAFMTLAEGVDDLSSKVLRTCGGEDGVDDVAVAAEVTSCSSSDSESAVGDGTQVSAVGDGADKGRDWVVKKVGTFVFRVESRDVTYMISE